MYRIIKKNELAPNVNEYVILAPDIALHSSAGQFVILRVDSEGERIPFTICDFDTNQGTVTILVQTVGYSTMKLAQIAEGEYINDIVGPLGNATDLTAYNKILLVGGGIGSAVIYPQSKYLKSLGKPADCIIGAKTQSLIMYEENFKKNSSELFIVTDDGSYGDKGFVTDKINALLAEGRDYDCVFAVGPLPMMRAVCNLTKKFGIKTVVSMNSVMVDGTGMCGSCRLSVGGVTRYACVDGPEFDGWLVDFDEAINRSRFYSEQEKEHYCRLKGGKA